MAELKCSDGTVVNISSETEQELRKAFEPKPPQLGDIVTCIHGRRVVLPSMLWHETEFEAFDYTGVAVGVVQRVSENFYTPTGENIFNGGVL
jgi:hypothetical protein